MIGCETDTFASRKRSGFLGLFPSPPETVRVIADEPAIERRVFGNLVENALRHTLYGRTVEVGVPD
jgi:signal transduction histidine kinase